MPGRLARRVREATQGNEPVERPAPRLGSTSHGRTGRCVRSAEFTRSRRIVAYGYPTGVLRDLVFGVCASAVPAWILYRAVAPLKAIWRGDTSRIYTLPTRSGIVQARNYLAYLLWVIPAFGGLMFIGVAIISATLSSVRTDLIDILFTIGVCSLLAAGPLLLVHVIVNATNRPRFLVPPPYRDQPGAIAAARKRRARRRVGQPPTDHLVEILDVRPPPGDDDYEPYLMAICSVDGCDWTAHVDPALGYAAAEADLRQRARKHTTNVATDIVRPLG